MSRFKTHEPIFLRFLQLVVHRIGGTPSQIARIVKEPVEIVEAALIHLRARGEIHYTRKRRPTKR